MKLNIFDDIVVHKTNEMLLEDITKYTAGTEGFVSVSIKILDSFIGILNNLRSMIHLPTNTVKRSEFKAYVQANLIGTRLLLRKNYTDIYDVVIPILTGNKLTYIQTIDELNIVLKELDIFSRTNKALDGIKDIHDALQTEERMITGPIQQAALLYSAKLNADIRKKLMSVLDISSKEVERPFSEVFKSMKEFHTSYDVMYDLADEYNMLAHILGTIDSIQKYVDKIITEIKERRIEFDRKDLILLSDVVRIYANMFETYGIVLHRQHNLDHNFTEVCRVLIDSKK